MTTNSLHGLLDRHEKGWSLEQSFYVDPEIFAVEQAIWFSRQWTVIAHASELPRKGSHIVRSLFGTSIIVVNSGDAGFRAYYNVCTHRGSRICKEDGHSPLLVCPYHAWSFRLTGELQSTRDLPAGVDPAELGLHEVPLRQIGSLILCGADAENLPDPARAEEVLQPALRHHGLDHAKIAVRRSYPTQANWKLVLENFFECYHCRPSHPEYFRMNGHVKVSAMLDDNAAQEWGKVVDDWRAEVGDDQHNRTVRVAGTHDEMKFTLYRHPIGLGRQTQSKDGRAVAPLMGGFANYDGGETAMHFGRFSFMGAYNDHAVLFQFIPRGVEETDVVATWFVDADADLELIDMDAMTLMWDITTKQDKQIIEENAQGVRSRAYRPGPYTQLEAQTSDFVESYVTVMRELLEAKGPVAKVEQVA
ncbi:Rieske 2Fe-2S family protein [Sphingobium sp. AP50]|uniref:aromatic ring-hydroxylating oxygenase subunit alpha n=1 Tax=Sphingobium sp. AP50 TaxID=1884369 RepID=UPI0008D37D80|nr:aromatic ring-hydroxylating dioxygenase subunit alpha [Sphingobium sp. AP50]SEK00416.1 Rieske 2Fe-2S family protein [Sphingobium sp. AP50]